jgi:histidine kinase
VRQDASPGDGSDDLERAVHDLTHVLLAVAQGDFDVRADRDHSGDAVDVLAFLVNSTAAEVGELIRALQAEKEELQRARGQLVLSAKLAALGELAAGVAHELNQPLTAVQMLLDMVRLHPDDRVGDHEADFQTIIEATRRMARIVSGVRAFGRSAEHRIASISAVRPLRQALELLSESFQLQGVEVECHLSDDLPQIAADADRLHQVFVNLLINARDALKEVAPGDPGRVIVEARADADTVIYAVQDNGPGVVPAHAHRIFDLFFTTKAVGEGTGLGLSVSHGIVADHGGRLYYEDAPGGGARFVVEVPIDGRPGPGRSQ